MFDSSAERSACANPINSSSRTRWAAEEYGRYHHRGGYASLTQLFVRFHKECRLVKGFSSRSVCKAGNASIPPAAQHFSPKNESPLDPVYLFHKVHKQLPFRRGPRFKKKFIELTMNVPHFRERL